MQKVALSKEIIFLFPKSTLQFIASTLMEIYGKQKKIFANTLYPSSQSVPICVKKSKNICTYILF